ncbi:MAG: sensor histidine kinase [Acidobacteriota bacterium]
MNSDQTLLLGALHWVLADQDGQPVILGTDGKCLAGETDPPLAAALAAGGSAGAPVRVMLPAQGGGRQPIDLVPAPGRAAIAVGIAPAAVEAALAAPVENLVNQIAHDVRNFAFTMGLQAELGVRRTAAAPDSRGHFEAVLRQVDALKGYLEQLLLFGRPVTLSPAQMDAGGFVRQIVQTYQFSWSPSAPPLTIKVDADPTAGAVHWDSRTLGAALRAVLDNAVRAATPPPPITVVVAPDGEDILVEVRDLGPGIPPETLEKLAVPMRVRRPGGAGLGLAIARKLAAANGGELILESGPTGTVVRFRLPREAPAT